MERILVLAAGAVSSLSSETCIGKSAAIPADQCAAWAEFFDGTNGNDWIDCQRRRLDPCSCNMGTESNSVCDEGMSVIENLVIPFNNLAGTLPSSLSALVNVTSLDLRGNFLTGPLPSLNWAAMDAPGDEHYCTLYDEAMQKHNAFDCPLPVGVLSHCKKSTKHAVDVPITAADCGPVIPTPAPIVHRYHCVNNTCTAAATGVTLRVCKRSCG